MEYNHEELTGDAGIENILQQNMSKNIRDLHTLVSPYITEKGDPNTNFISVAERKTYNLPVSKLEQFFTLLDACRLEKRMLHYSEKQETADISHSGIMIDFDIYQRSATRELDEEIMNMLTTDLVNLLLELLEMEDTRKFMVFYIFKPKPVADGDRYKDGFHILIPELQVIRGFKKYFLQEILNRKILDPLFEHVSLTIPVADVLDKQSASGPVHFFGNSKPQRVAYPLTHAYSVCTRFKKPLINHINPDIVFTPAVTELPSVCPVYELSLLYMLPTFNGISTWLKKRPYRFKEHLETNIKLIVEKTAKHIIDEDDLLAADDSVDILTITNAEAKYMKKLLEIIDISYASTYEKWFKVICSIAHTSVHYKPLAVYFSHRKPESWSPAELDRVWNEACKQNTANPITKKSLEYWARTSSPQKFTEIQKETYVQILARATYENGGRIEHATASKIIYSMVGDKFVTTDAPDGSKSAYHWYEFVLPGQHMKKGEVYKWRKEKDPDNLHLFIGEHLPKVYEEQLTRIKDRAGGDVNDEAEAKYLKNLAKTLESYKCKLGNHGFQSGVVSQCVFRFRDRTFADELDSYADLLGVGNGVLRLGTQPELIRGFHEYKISKFTPVDYIPFDRNRPKTKRLLAAYADIFPEPDVLLFMLCHASTGLDAHDASGLFVSLVGGGQNGKTFFVKMQHNTLGHQYCATLKPTLLTSPIEKGDSANSSQMQMRGKRYGYFDEFNKCEIINIARLKAMANPGYQTGRDLHEKASNFKNTCNPIALSNYDFVVNTTDHGTWRRYRYYKSKVTFKETPDPNNKWEKQVDTDLIDNVANDPSYLEENLSILVEYNRILRTYYGNDLKNIPTPTLKRETEIFRNKQDALHRFITLYVVRSPDAEPIVVATVAAKYREWYKDSYKHDLSMVDCESQLENSTLTVDMFMESNVRMLRGYRVKCMLSEPLRDGETTMAAHDEPENNTAPIAFPHMREYIYEQRTRATHDDLGDETFNHIQITEHVDQTIIDDLDDLDDNIDIHNIIEDL